jgi:hypothetical protein
MFSRTATLAALLCSVAGICLALVTLVPSGIAVDDLEARAIRIGQTQSYFACKPNASCSSCSGDWRCSSDSNYWICVEGGFQDKCTWTSANPNCGTFVQCDPGCVNCSPPSSDPCPSVTCVH